MQAINKPLAAVDASNIRKAHIMHTTSALPTAFLSMVQTNTPVPHIINDNKSGIPSPNTLKSETTINKSSAAIGIFLF